MLGPVLAGCLLASAASTALATAVLLVRHPSRAARPAPSRPLAAAASLAVLAAGPAVVASLGGTLTAVLGAAVLLGGATLAWLPLTRSWSWRGHLAWTATTCLTLSYLAYMLRVSVAPGRTALGVTAALLLWVLEAVTAGVSGAYLWEVVDALSRVSWPRRRDLGRGGDGTADIGARRTGTALGAGTDVGAVRGAVAARTGTASLPFVSLHVPAHNEPPDMVIATVESLLALDYPAYEVVVVDNNTTDPALWQPVAAFCQDRGVTFLHLQDWPGFKSGALNEVLRAATDPRAEVIGVVDADYLVAPDYLRRCAPLFADPALAFVQTPQNYRDWQHARYYRRLFYSYEYFFRVSQPVRNEVDGAIFGGTMGLIRRSALLAVGGWDEWCITEDAELSLKLLRAGWHGQHVEHAFGRGIMPLTFEALKRQRFRWCFGGVQILRAHWRSLLPWDRDPDNHLSQAQRWAYLAGGLQWFTDLFGLLFAGFLVLGAVDQALGTGLVLRRLSGPLLGLPVALVGLGLLRAVAVLTRRTTATTREALGALWLWLALGPTVAWACARGLTEPAGVFLRTPKTKTTGSWQQALRANRTEAGLAAVLLACATAAATRLHPAALTVAVLLGWQASGLLAAPLNSLAAQRADLPSALRRRRATEWLREWIPTAPRVRPLVATTAVLALAAGVAGIALLPGGVPAGPAHDILGDVRGRPVVLTPARHPRHRAPGTVHRGPTPGIAGGSVTDGAAAGTATAGGAAGGAASGSAAAAHGPAGAGAPATPSPSGDVTPGGAPTPSASLTARRTTPPSASTGPTATPGSPSSHRTSTGPAPTPSRRPTPSPTPHPTSHHK